MSEIKNRQESHLLGQISVALRNRKQARTCKMQNLPAAQGYVSGHFLGLLSTKQTEPTEPTELATLEKKHSITKAMGLLVLVFLTLDLDVLPPTDASLVIAPSPPRSPFTPRMSRAAGYCIQTLRLQYRCQKRGSVVALPAFLDK